MTDRDARVYVASTSSHAEMWQGWRKAAALDAGQALDAAHITFESEWSPCCSAYSPEHACHLDMFADLEDLEITHVIRKCAERAGITLPPTTPNWGAT